MQSSLTQTLEAKKRSKQKSDPAIQTACQKEDHPENFINLGQPQAKWILS